MPGGLAELVSLGVDPAGMPLRGIAYLDEQTPSRSTIPHGRAGRGVRRTTLHAALASRAKEQDTEWISTRVTSVDQDAHGVMAAGVRAKWLIAADGLHSAVRRAVGISVVAGRPRRHGVRWHYRVPAWSEFVEVHWSRWGEAYVTPVEPDLVGVAILSKAASGPCLVPRAGPPSARRRPWPRSRLRTDAPGRVPPRRRDGCCWWATRPATKTPSPVRASAWPSNRPPLRCGRSPTTHPLHTNRPGAEPPAITACSPADWC